LQTPLAGGVRRIVFHPLALLTVIFLGVYLDLQHSGKLDPKLTNDFISYELTWEATSLADALSSVRTFGYPLVLGLFGDEAGKYTSFPEIHLLFQFAAVMLLWAAVRAYSGSSWFAFAFAAPLAVPCHLKFVNWVQPDFLAPSMAIVALAALIYLVARPGHKWVWPVLGFTTFATYMLRPDHVFLVAFIPLTGAVLYYGWRPTGLRAAVRFATGLALVCMTPLLAFFGLRWATVGQFSVVNFDGYSMIGIAAPMIDEELIAELPEVQHELATDILEERRRRRLPVYEASSWTRAWHKHSSKNIWRISEPLARAQLVRERDEIEEIPDLPFLLGDLSLVINERLGTLAWSVIERRPELYLKWIYDSYRNGLNRSLKCGMVGLLTVILLLSTLIVMFDSVGRRSQEMDASPQRETGASGRYRVVFAVCFLAVGYFLVKLLLIVAVNEPADRFLMSSMMFLPSALAVGVFQLLLPIVSRLSRDSSLIARN
jgi:hypothetical protein